MQFSGPFGHARWVQGSDVSAAESLDGIRNCCWNTRRATYRASPSLWHPSQAQRAISTAASQNPAINCLFSLTISLPEVASSLSGTLLWLSKIVCLHKALSLHNGEGTLRVSNSCSWEHLSKYCWGKKCERECFIDSNQQLMAIAVLQDDHRNSSVILGLIPSLCAKLMPVGLGCPGTGSKINLSYRILLCSDYPIIAMIIMVVPHS